jgi:hypothetical protein
VGEDGKTLNAPDDPILRGSPATNGQFEINDERCFVGASMSCKQNGVDPRDTAARAEISQELSANIHTIQYVQSLTQKLVNVVTYIVL